MPAVEIALGDVSRRVLSVVGALAFWPARLLERAPGWEQSSWDAAWELHFDGRLRISDMRLSDGEYVFVQITRAGLSAIASQLPAPDPLVSMADLRRNLMVASCWTEAWSGRYGVMDRVLSARELAGLDRAAVQSGGSASGFDLGPGSALVYPDVGLVRSSGERIAVFLWMWPWTEDPVALCEQVAGRRGIDSAWVWSGSPDQAERIRHAAQRVGVSDRVRSEWFTHPSLVPPAHERDATLR